MSGTDSSGGRTRPPRPARVVGYVIAALVHVAVWAGVVIWPGWETIPFLSSELPRVLGLFTLSIAANVAANIVFIAYDARWFKAAGELVLAVIALAFAWRVFVVFPFDFTGLSYDLTTLARVVVVLGVIGSAIGILTSLVSFVREVSRATAGPRSLSR